MPLLDNNLFHEDMAAGKTQTPTPRRKPSGWHTKVVIVKNYNDK